MEKGKRVDTPRKMGKVYKNKQHKTGFPRAVLPSSPTWGMWIETASASTISTCADRSSPTWGMWIETARYKALGNSIAVIPHMGDVD